MAIRWRHLLGTLTAGTLVLQLMPAAGQQRGPIQLFPEVRPGEEPPAPRELDVAPRVPPGAPTEGLPAGEAPGRFRVEGLEAPAVDAAGLGGGLGPDLWQGSDPELVLNLLADLPVVTQNPPLRELTRRLLITGADLPGGRGGRLLEARVERLLAMGDLSSAAGLLEQLPPTDRDTPVVRSAADVALLQGDDDRACRLAQDVAPASQAPFWGKLTVYCRLRTGDVDGARLALDLLREREAGDDAAFFALAEIMASSGAAGSVPELAEPSPLHVAMARAAGLPLDEAALAEPSPPLLAAITRAPALAPDGGLALVERGFAMGVLGGTELAARYLEAAPDDGGGDVLAEIEADWGPGARALVLQRVQQEQLAGARAELLDAVWRAARGPERTLVAHAFDRSFVELPLEDGLTFAAPSAARALLGVERPVPAARWFGFLRTAGAADAQAQQAAAALAPLFALAGFGGSEQVPRPSEEMIAAWQDASAAGGEQALLLLALLEGVGARVAPEVWLALLDPPFQTEVRRPVMPLWRILETAQADQQRGLLMLSALHMLAGDPGEGDLEATVAGLQALRAAGFDREARGIALASALMQGL